MHPQLGGHPGVHPKLSVQMIYFVWPGNASGFPRGNWKVLIREEDIWDTLACCPHDQTSDNHKTMEGLHKILPLNYFH